MSIARLNPVNLILIFILTVLLSGFQTTFWFQIFGSLPAPLLWLNLVLYLILYRKSLEGILTIYGIGVLLHPYTAMPLGYLWLSLLIAFVVMTFVKKRVFWTGSRYFFMASIGIGFTYHITYFFISRGFDTNPAALNFFHRSFEIVFTALASIPTYALLAWIDQVTHKEILPEGGSAET